MKDNIYLGLGGLFIPIPRFIWRRLVTKNAIDAEDNLNFMTADHHEVRDFVVKQIPKVDEPIPAAYIAEHLDMRVEVAERIIEDLEKGMTFLYRSRPEGVTWAYPVTVDNTPHRVSFSSGEQTFAAWGIDAVATPFVQGQLKEQTLAVTIHTECACCGQTLTIELDSELNYNVKQQDAKPLVFVPLVNFNTLEDPGIIDAFWRHSVFFWSEEHAKVHRQNSGGKRGIYLTLEQSADLTRLTQSALFAFPREQHQTEQDND